MMSRVRLAAIAVAAQALVATAAMASTIVSVSSQADLSPNDSIVWDSLGGDGSTVASSFTTTTTNNVSVSGSLAGGSGVICDNVFDSCSIALNDTSIQSNNGSGGTGPITLNLPGVSGFGTTILSSAAFNYGYVFSASLALYHGSTLLGTVTGTNDGQGSPFYLGAIDQDGAEITSVVLSLASIGRPATDAVPATYVTYDYDPFAGHIDSPMCTSAPPSVFTIARNVLSCPQKAFLVGITWPYVVPIANAPMTGDTLTTYPFITARTNAQPAQPDTTDTNPSDLADLAIGGVDLLFSDQSSPTDTPEPGSLVLLGAGVAGLRALRRRRGEPDRF